jgi:hypothetical protein
MRCLIVIVFILRVTVVSAQEEIFVTANVNSYFPSIGHGAPVLLLGTQTRKPKIFFGGFGIGASMIKKLAERLTLKAAGNLSRHTYQNAPIEMRDNNNVPLGEYTSHSNDYLFSIQGLGRFSFTDKINFGAGLGFDLMLVSKIRNPVGDFSGIDSKDISIRERNYKPVMPVVPVELSIKNTHAFYTLRYEQALLNKFRGDLAKTAKTSYGTVLFEVGIRIK